MFNLVVSRIFNMLGKKEDSCLLRFGNVLGGLFYQCLVASKFHFIYNKNRRDGHRYSDFPFLLERGVAI